MKSLLNMLIPCWYELSFLKEEMAILLRIHEDFAKGFKPIHQRFANQYLERYKFNGFLGGFEGSFSFNGALNRRDDKGGFLEFIIGIPRVKWQSEETCEECHGSGKRKKPFENDQCNYCKGTGEKTENDWQSVLAISASLSLLFQMMDQPPESNTSALIPQIMTLRINTGQGRDNSPIWAEYGIPVCDWLLAQKDGVAIPEIATTIQSVYSHMIFNETVPYQFSAHVHGGNRLSLKCDNGDVFIPGIHIMKEGEGCKAMCDEIDSPAMQIALISGLATLHDLIRKSSVS